MLQSSARPSPDTAPLVADLRDQPAPRRRRARRRAVIAGIAIGALTIGAGVFAVAGFAAAGVVPPPVLEASTPEPVESSSPTSPVESTDPTTDATPASVVTDTLSGQGAWLAEPTTEPIGVAYILPGADDDPATLVQDETAVRLLAGGWAVASGALTGRSWGSPASTQSLVELRGWVDEQLGELPALYVGAGMGATTAVTSMARQPELAVACVYAIAPVTDLATLIGAQPAVADDISVAWQGIPSADQNPSLLTASLPLETAYRVVTPTAPQVLVDDATLFIATLEESGHTVSSITAPDNATPQSLTDDLSAFAEGCSA